MKDRIKTVRKSAGLTQELFGKKVGVSASAEQKWELGLAVPSDAVIMLICRNFSVNETWLRTGEGEMYRPRSREQELGEGIRAILIDRPESFQAALISTLLKFDPDGPEWTALERIMAELQKETKKDPEP